MSTKSTGLASPSISNNKQPPPNSALKHPCQDLLDGTEDYTKICIPLYSASINGNWEAANEILSKRPDLVTFSITENLETALHIAVSAQNTKFVEALLKIMKDEDLELQNIKGNTALCFAAAAGNRKLAEILVNRNRKLLNIPGSRKMMPLYIAAIFRHHDTVKYLYDNSQNMIGEHWTDENRGWVLLRCVEAGFFDVAIKIFKERPKLARDESVLVALARTPYTSDDRDPRFSWRAIKSCRYLHLFFGVNAKERESEAMQFLKIVWKNIMEMARADIHKLLKGPIDPKMKDEKENLHELLKGPTDAKLKDEKENLHELLKGPTDPKLKDEKENLHELLKIPTDPKLKDENENLIMTEKVGTYSSHVLFVAAEMGNTEFLIEVIRQYPDLMWKVNDNNQTIFHVAVTHRHERIYNLLHEIGSMKDLITAKIDNEGNNMLHLVGMKAKKNGLHDVSGDAFQMQWELLWFKEVEAMVPFSYRKRTNKDGKTPRELFTENHIKLVSKGKEWMNGTATQCMVVATLIATIVFGVAFSIPGGYDQNSGFPMFIRKKIYIAFVISDAISLILSATSILMFLSLLTSRYEEQDFLKSLPQKLMIGLATLFLSITTMMVAFSLSFFVLYHSKLIWVPVVISIVAAVPVILYAKLHRSLLMDVYHSLYGYKYIFKPKQRLLFQNPKF